MSYVFDFPNSIINITSPQTEVNIQDLYTAIRAAESTVEGMMYAKIAEGSGKQDLGGGAMVGLTVKLLGSWQIKFWAGTYQASISGGNLVGDSGGGNAGNPIAYSAGVQVVKNQSAAATVVESGGGSTLTASQIRQEMDANSQIMQAVTLAQKLLRNKAVTDPTTGKLTVYDDDNTTVLVQGDLFENAEGTIPYKGEGSEHRGRLT